MGDSPVRRTKNAPVKSAQKRTVPAKTKPKKEEKDKDRHLKRIAAYSLVIALMFILFYAYQYIQMANIRNSLDRQIASVKVTNQSELGSLKVTLGQIHENYPNASQYTADSVFSAGVMSGRIEARTTDIINESEKEIKAVRERTPFMFITDFIMPGAQKSTDEHYRAAIRNHVTDPEFVEFNAVKLEVDDLMAGVNYCRSVPTELTYGYTDPIPDASTKAARTAVVQEAAKRHLCPEKP